MMGASHDEAQLDVPLAHESVDSRGSIAGGRQMLPAELAQMEAAGYEFAPQFATAAATMPGELLLPLLPGDRTAPNRQHAYVQDSYHDVSLASHPHHDGGGPLI